jgi:hypothetical protein
MYIRFVYFGKTIKLFHRNDTIYLIVLKVEKWVQLNVFTFGHLRERLNAPAEHEGNLFLIHLFTIDC